MSRRGRIALVSGGSVVVALLAALLTWVWFDQMEQRWQARYQESEQLRDNPMLAATLLLQAHHYEVRAVPTLDETLRGPLPDGTLLLADQGGQMTPQQTAQLLQWVGRGNTLITLSQWAPRLAAVPAKSAAASAPRPTGGRAPLAPLVDADPLGARYGVALNYHSKSRTSCAGNDAPVPPRGEANDVTHTRSSSSSSDDDDSSDNGGGNGGGNGGDNRGGSGNGGDSADGNGNGGGNGGNVDGGGNGNGGSNSGAGPANLRHIACITLQTPYPLALEMDNMGLDPTDGAPQPAWSDSDGLAVRGYAEGRGTVVFLARPYFSHDALRRYDHAELLLALARLHPGAGRVTIVRQLRLPTWHGALWRAAWPFLCALALLLSLLFWRALLRFGPQLPEAAQPRRALLEHIDASGNWLWQAAGGRELLLAAARGLTDDALRRRAPALAQLDLPQRIAELAQRHAYSVADLRLALADAPARRPQLFTRQIELLQQLRTHYER